MDESTHDATSSGESLQGELPAATRAADNDSRAFALGFGERLVGERAGRFHFLDPNDIDYIEANGNYVNIHVRGERYINRDSLRRLTPLLQPREFVRISRSVLINLRRVEYAEREGCGVLAFVLHSGDRLLSSAGYRIVAGAPLQVTRTRTKVRWG